MTVAEQLTATAKRAEEPSPAGVEGFTSSPPPLVAARDDAPRAPPPSAVTIEALSPALSAAPVPVPVARVRGDEMTRSFACAATVTSVAMVPSGCYVLTGASDGSMRLYSMLQGIAFER